MSWFDCYSDALLTPACQFHWASEIQGCIEKSGGVMVTFIMVGPDPDELDVTVCSFDQPAIVTPADHLGLTTGCLGFV